MQPSLLPVLSLTVTDLTRYLRQLLEGDEVLQGIWVQGEVSNLSRPSSGHIYFTLKDENAALRCVIWRTSALRLKVSLQNGMALEAHGAISVYERDGTYQLYVDGLRLAGEGRLLQEFLRLKARLEAEGLFAEERKRPIPTQPQRIGIVTSPTGAALQDILNTFQRRYTLAEIILAPSAMQGDEAPAQICAAIRAVNALAQPDVILLARGGGSLEDLWAFNDEQVVRAIVASQAPVISGIGHETDFTLADFAADMRAPTPTGAAMLATPDSTDLLTSLAALANRFITLFQYNLDNQHSRLEMAGRSLQRSSPIWLINNERQRLDNRQQSLERSSAHLLQLRSARLQGSTQRLAALNPLAILQRGYAIVEHQDGTIISSVTQVHSGENIAIHVKDGSFNASVNQEIIQKG
jgi:exodeoxyribonuclease VII large subunit